MVRLAVLALPAFLAALQGCAAVRFSSGELQASEARVAAIRGREADSPDRCVRLYRGVLREQARFLRPFQDYNDLLVEGLWRVVREKGAVGMMRPEGLPSMYDRRVELMADAYLGEGRCQAALSDLGRAERAARNAFELLRARALSPSLKARKIREALTLLGDVERRHGRVGHALVVELEAGLLGDYQRSAEGRRDSGAEAAGRREDAAAELELRAQLRALARRSAANTAAGMLNTAASVASVAAAAKGMEAGAGDLSSGRVWRGLDRLDSSLDAPAAPFHSSAGADAPGGYERSGSKPALETSLYRQITEPALGSEPLEPLRAFLTGAEEAARRQPVLLAKTRTASGLLRAMAETPTDVAGTPRSRTAAALARMVGEVAAMLRTLDDAGRASAGSHP